MKRIVFATMLMLGVSTGISHAQSFTDRLHFEVSEGVACRHNNIRQFDTSFKLGVDISKRLYAFAAYEGNVALYSKNDVRTYFSGGSLGGGLGFKLMNDANFPLAFDLRVMALTSLGGSKWLGGEDWKRTNYDASLVMYLNSNKKHYITPVLGLGYRYTDSRTVGLKNMGNIYASIGFRF